MFRERGHAWQGAEELFRVDSWTQVMLGQGITPEHYHYMTRAMSDQDLTRFLDSIRGSVNRALEGMPPHQDFLNSYCKASDDFWTAAKPAASAM